MKDSQKISFSEFSVRVLNMRDSLAFHLLLMCKQCPDIGSNSFQSDYSQLCRTFVCYNELISSRILYILQASSVVLVWLVAVFPELGNILLLMKPSHHGSIFWAEMATVHQNDEYVTYLSPVCHVTKIENQASNLYFVCKRLWKQCTANLTRSYRCRNVLN